jgi:4-hydroxy-2-oxoheptanedioate aldolase
MSEPTAFADTLLNPQLRLLNALRNDSKPIMTFMGLPSFRAAQLVAQTGLDVGVRPRQYPVIPH